MAHPADNSQVLKTADEVRAYELEKGVRSRDAEVAALSAQVASLTEAYHSLEQEYLEHMETHTFEPEPRPPVTTSTLIGMSAPANLWVARKKEVEATGGKLQARRVFLTGLGSSLTLVQAAHAEGLFPLVSFKPGDWGDMAAGKSDAAVRTLATNLGKLGKPVAVCFHHEPDTQSTPADVGEGGTAAEFAAMYRRVTPLLKAAPNVQVWPIMNGWWWTSEKRKLTDAQINVWLPADVRKMVDGVAADDYSPEGGEPGVVKTRNRVAWMKRVGDVKGTGIGETNAYTPKDLQDSFDYAASEPLVKFALVWNSDGGAYLPLSATGLLDDFQRILLGWPAKAS